MNNRSTSGSILVAVMGIAALGFGILEFMGGGMGTVDCTGRHLHPMESSYPYLCWFDLPVQRY